MHLSLHKYLLSVCCVLGTAVSLGKHYRTKQVTTQHLTEVIFHERKKTKNIVK